MDYSFILHTNSILRATQSKVGYNTAVVAAAASPVQLSALPDHPSAVSLGSSYLFGKRVRSEMHLSCTGNHVAVVQACLAVPEYM